MEYLKPDWLLGQTGHLNWSEEVTSWQDTAENQAPDEIFALQKIDEYSEAKRKELKSWIDKDVYEEVENSGQDTITLRWVLTKKDTGELKARLVARGFQENQENLVLDSPTCARESFRLLLTIAATKQWQIHSLDVKTAFLQGVQLSRCLFVKPPKEAETNNLWKLKKCVYGLADAARKWFDRVVQFLTQQNMVQSRLDKAVFLFGKPGELSGLICLHVDDFIWTGDEYFVQRVIDPLRSTFAVEVEAEANFRFLGLDVTRSSDRAINLAQTDYIQSLIQDIPSKLSIEGDPRQITGKLEWISGQTRPDLSFDIVSFTKLSSENPEPFWIDEEDIEEVAIFPRHET